MASAGDTPSLAAKVAFLRSAQSYPDTTDVQTRETHMSWVFLTDRYAYKLKKPVANPVLDYRRLEAREHFCREELRLNRRLAPRVYLDVVPLLAAGDVLRLGLPGARPLGPFEQIADWLVEMRRLPSERMLDAAIGDRTAQRSELVAIGSRLGSFFAGAAPVLLGTSDYLARLEGNVAEQHAALARHGLAGARLDRIASDLDGVLHRHRDDFAVRCAEARIVEGHGDLRPEHVYLGGDTKLGPAVIDCLEFSYDLRVADSADELAFLRLECSRLGSYATGQIILDAYTERTGDRPPDHLLAFYAGARALVRAKLALWHDHDQPQHAARWLRRAETYLDLAEAAIAGRLPYVDGS